MARKEDVITVDMTAAVTFDILPEKTAYLSRISAWKLGRSASGGKKLHWEATIEKPEKVSDGDGKEVKCVNRKFIEDLSLDNEYTLGRFKGILKAFGYSEDDLNSKKFVVPTEEDMLGRALTLFAKTVKSEEYGDQSRVGRVRPAEAFEEAA